MTTFETFRDQARAGGVIPVVRRCVLDADTPVAVLTKIRRGPWAFLLESLVGGERWARYTFLGTDPKEVWRYSAGGVERWSRGAGWADAVPVDDPLTHLSTRLRGSPARAVSGLPRFVGGAVGFWGYDVIRTIEQLPNAPVDDTGLPTAMVMIADTLVIIDNLYGKAILVANVETSPNMPDDALRPAYDAALGRLDDLRRRLESSHTLGVLPDTDGASEAMPETVHTYPREQFERDVRRIKEYIAAGDCLQTVLSRRQDVTGGVDALRLYRYLRALNPAPYLFYLQFDDIAVVGSSPEVLVRVEDGEVTLRPIAGTRPRGATTDEDRRLAEELIADPKERAEHVMLVDLGRNDVGRVADFGSVRVTDSFTLERYSHVQHIVSEVRGKLREGLDALDVLRACFPAGTLSGAPKIRAMEIIDELEPVRRGVYGGAVGYIGWGAKNLDTAIAIRSAVVLPDRTLVQAGAGIVADSDPAREYEETQSKARAMLRALALARGGY